MTVRSAVEARQFALSMADPDGPDLGLPIGFRRDQPVRTALLKRFAAGPRFSFGNKSGRLRASAGRSDPAFRTGVRQRVMVKVFVSRHLGSTGGAALAAHVRYLGRESAGRHGEAAEYFDQSEDKVGAALHTADWHEHRHHFRVILSPEYGERITDLRDYTRDTMKRVCADLGEPGLPWLAVCHYDTEHPHAHVLMPGRRADSRDLVIPRAYVAYGFRARAQEAAQERLGDLSRHDPEHRIWRQTQRDGFTAFDRRLVAAMDDQRRVEDAAGQTTAWAALTRGRLGHLEALGLAERHGRHFRLAKDLERRLQGLQISRDASRTINQRRMATGRDIKVFRAGRLSGKVVAAGAHDELGASPYVILRDAQGSEHYARLAPGAAPALGAKMTLEGDARGTVKLLQGRSRPLRGLDAGR